MNYKEIVNKTDNEFEMFEKFCASHECCEECEFCNRNKDEECYELYLLK